MYFLWKTTKHGIIRVSCDGLKDFAGEVLSSKLRLYSITIHPADSDNDAEMSIVLSDDDVAPETRKTVDDNFPAVMKPMGLNASVVWATPERSIAAVLKNAWAWSGAAVCAAVLVTAGAAGFFWAAFWGAAAWFTVRGLGLLARKFGRF